MKPRNLHTALAVDVVDAEVRILADIQARSRVEPQALWPNPLSQSLRTVVWVAVYAEMPEVLG